MAFIAVNELSQIGSELFQDTESFLNDLHHLDDAVHGGGDDYSKSTNGVLDLAVKGFEFGVITYGIDAIGHLAQSFSDAGYYY